MALAPTVSIRLLRVLLEGAERAGIARAELLRAAQFDERRLADLELRIPRAEFFALCELALDHSGDQALGLHCGETTTGGGHMVAQVMANAVSLRQALQTLVQIQTLLSDAPLFEVVGGDGRTNVRHTATSDASPRVSRFMAELVSGGLFRMIRRFARGALPRQVCFAYRAPPYRAEYTRVFGGTERFEQPFSGIVFDAAVMDLTSADGDHELHDALHALAVQRVERHVLPLSYSERLKHFLQRQERPAKLNMAAVAEGLGMSVRSLRRRLAMEGVSYNAIACAAFAERAQRHLSLEQRTIQETSYLLGYTDSAAFHRAFKRWTGMTPSAVLTKRHGSA